VLEALKIDVRALRYADKKIKKDDCVYLLTRSISCLNSLTNEEVAYLHTLYKHKCDKIDIENLNQEDINVLEIYNIIDIQYNKI